MTYHIGWDTTHSPTVRPQQTYDINTAPYDMIPLPITNPIRLPDHSLLPSLPLHQNCNHNNTHMSKDSNNALVLTAVAAAAAGATVGVLLTSYTRRRTSPDHHRQRMISVPSVIFNPTEHNNDKLMPHQHEEKMKRQIAARALVEEDNFQPRESVTVRVPASSANMGPGCTFVRSSSAVASDRCELGDLLR